MKYRMFRLGRLQWEDCQVIEKKTYQLKNQHIYMLIGLDSCNKRASIHVTKATWDRFDVPITDNKEIKKKKQQNHHDYELNKKNNRKSAVIPCKGKRRNYDENIEKWIAEHYGLDYNKLVNDPYKEDF